MHTKRLTTLCAFGVATVAAAGVASADSNDVAGHAHLLPERNDDPSFRDSAWQPEGDWVRAPEDAPLGGGSRVAALLGVADDGPAVEIEARGVSGDERGAWRPLAETFRGEGSRVAVVDLDEEWPAAELRVAARDERRVGDLAWELLEPVYPEAGERARSLAREGDARGQDRSLDPALADLGVKSRDEWGARPTACTAQEDNWYRMAIHHTAGGQTSGGSVSAAVRAVQAYHQDSGTWCDIAYQFLVGHDGSLYEGRALHLRSGATGGANTGNVAVSFLGCYHPSGCPAGSHSVTDAMMSGALQLIQRVADIHDIAISGETILGHRDYGGGTACPGDFVHGRLDELRREQEEDDGGGAASFAAELRDGAAPLVHQGGDPLTGSVALATDTEIELVPGKTATVEAEFTNVGSNAWEPGVTYLAPTSPRDAASPLSDGSWPAPDRAATVNDVVQPGETATFRFEIHGAEAGEFEESFGLVHEGVTWFADEPLGGGPSDEAVSVTVSVAEGGGGGDGRGESGEPGADGDGATVAGGCQAGGGGGPLGGAALILASLLALRAVAPRRAA